MAVRRIVSGMFPRRRAPATPLDARGLRAAQRRFSEIFPRRFHDESYVEWEREYKWRAHELWHELLGRDTFAGLLADGAHDEIARRAVAVYTRPKLNMFALYEWMALREALDEPHGAARFGPPLFDLVYGEGPVGPRFDAFVAALDALPQRQSRVAKWPVATLYPWVAFPDEHLVVKPNLMKRAAESLGFDLRYASRPNQTTYAAVLALAAALREALSAWRPRDLIDVQGFIWVTHSEEYADWPWED